LSRKEERKEEREAMVDVLVAFVLDADEPPERPDALDAPGRTGTAMLRWEGGKRLGASVADGDNA
jgi:hypothetical protein